MPQHHSVVEFCFPEPWLLIAGGEDLYGHIFALPAAPPHLSIPALPCGRSNRWSTWETFFVFPSKHSQPDSVLETSPFLSADEPVTSDCEVQPQPMAWNKVTTHITEAIWAHAFTSSVWVLVDPFCEKNALPITFALCFFMWRWDYSFFLIYSRVNTGHTGRPNNSCRKHWA